MSRALFTAISGLNNFQQMLDVTSNNISNMNSTGYKSSRVNFQELMSQTNKPGSAPSGDLGGRNPVQIGLGSKIASIDRVFTQGALEITDSATDLAITGDGFFIVEEGVDQGYTRNGHFSVDVEGYLVDDSGRYVQGWQANTDGVVDSEAAIGRIQIPVGKQTISRPTTDAAIGGNLDAREDIYSAGPPATGGRTLSEMTVYDSLGEEHRVTFTYTKVAASGTAAASWDWEAVEDGNVVGNGTLSFDSTGLYDGTNSTVPPINIAPTNGADPLAINFDFSTVTQLASIPESEIVNQGQNGYSAGTLTDFEIDGSGKIIGRYSNGQLAEVAQVATAFFGNPRGLEGGQGGVFLRSGNSGEPVIGEPGNGARGSLTAGALEMSNVDLTAEFSRLILAQRAFQANSRVITTMDEVLSEVNNLKR